jgi:hypothetical protein
MPDPSSIGGKRRVRLGLALAFIVAGGAVAIWSQPRNMSPSTFPVRKVRVVGRVWTRLPGVDVAGLSVQLMKRDQPFPPGPTLGMRSTQTDASGRFELVGDAPATAEGEAEVYLLSSPADDRWTYRPAVVMLQPGRPAEGVEIELIEGVEVRGQFVDAGSGDPVGPVRVAAIGPGRISFLGTITPILRTDGRGSFRFRLVPGEAEVIAFEFPPAYVRSYPQGFRQKVEVPDGVSSFTVPPLRLRSPRPEELTAERAKP